MASRLPIVLVILVSTAAATLPASTDCRIAVSEQDIQASVQQFPHLAVYLTNLLGDPLIPPSAKRVIHEAVANQKTNILELTKDLKASEVKKGGCSVHSKHIISVKPSGEKTTFLVFDLDPSVSLDTSVHQARDPRVTIEANEESAFPEESLLHELAHIRFIIFLDRNFQKMAKNGYFPDNTIIELADSPGIYALRQDFYIYLSERYAYEMQFQYRKATLYSNAYYVRHLHPTFGYLLIVDEPAARKRIVAHILKHHAETRCDSFRQFDQMPVTRILRWKPIREIDTDLNTL